MERGALGGATVGVLRLSIWSVVGLIAVLASVSGLRIAQAADGLAFVDDAPMEFDLNQPPGSSQIVEVVNTGAQTLPQLTLRISGLPTGTVVVEDPVRTGLQAGAVATFKIVRKAEADPSQGHLVALGSNGAIARRTVILTFQSASQGDDLDEVVLQAWRIWPWRDRFEVDPVAVEGAENIAGDGAIAFVSTDADVARVTFDNGAFGVTDLDRVGEYTGKADLRPGTEGGDLTIKVLAKDIWIWPLTALLVGLGLVSLLNQYARRERPAELLKIRLARLLNEASREEAASQEYLRALLPNLDLVVPRIRGQGDKSLLLDSETDKALVDWSNALDDTDRKEFDPEGERWKQLKGYLDDYRALLEQLKGVGQHLALIRVHPGEPAGQWKPAEASTLEPALELLRPPSGIENGDDLRRRKKDVDSQRLRLETLLGIQEMLLAVWSQSTTLKDEAAAQLRLLWRAAGDLTIEDTRAKELYKRSFDATTSPSVEPDRQGRRPSFDDERWMEAGGEFPAQVPRRYRRRRGDLSWRDIERYLQFRRRRGPIIAIIAALLLAATTLLARPSLPSLEPGLQLKPPSAMTVNLVGLVLLVGFSIPIVLIVRRLIRAQQRGRLHGEDEKALRHALDRRDTAYACLSGLLVILSGMSLVYAADATFGTPGDYLTILLWGTAVSEGLSLAKRLLPNPIS